MNRHEYRLDLHPDDDQLDRLRAGLLDGTPEHEELHAHLAVCETCRRRLRRWETLARAAFAADEHDAGLRRALQNTRRAGAVAARTPRFFQPLALAATLAVLAVGLAAALYPTYRTTSAPVQTAETQAPAPDLLADIDFYLWLSRHEAESSLPPGSS